jgi:hypothetical protein
LFIRFRASLFKYVLLLLFKSFSFSPAVTMMSSSSWNSALSVTNDIFGASLS